MQRMLECPICAHGYDTKGRVPKTMPCGHVLCSPCILRIVIGRMLSCPTCRVESTLHNISQLPTSYATLDILDASCEVCRDQSWRVKCEHCTKKLCDSCKTTHQHVEHMDSFKGDNVEEELQSLSTLMTGLKEVISDDTQLQQIVAQRENVIEQIKRTYQERVLLLEKQQVNLMSQVIDQEKQDTTKQLNWRDEVASILSEADAFHATCLARSESNSQIPEASYDNSASRIRDQCTRYMTALEACEKSKPQPTLLAFTANNDEFESMSLKCQHLSKNFTSPTAEDQPRGRLPDYKNARSMISKGGEGCQPGQFDSPIGICVSPYSKYYFISDRLNHRVQVLSGNLQVKFTFGSAGKGDKNFSCPYGIAVNKRGNIFIADEYNHRIQVADEFGRFLYKFGEQGPGPDNLNYPKGLAFGADDALYIADSGNKRIKVVDYEGKFMRVFGSDGGPRFNSNPLFIAVSSEGNVAVSDSEGSVHLFSDYGHYSHTIRGGSVPHNLEAVAVTFDEYHHILVTDKAGHIVVLKDDGEFVCRIGTPGDGPGLLKKPKGIATTREGHIIVCDTGNHRVQLIAVPFKG